jgi:transcriptional regulator with XRE-family HTH domain
MNMTFCDAPVNTLFITHRELTCDMCQIMRYRLNIKAKRTERGFSKVTVAKAMRLSVATISAWERDAANPHSRQPSALQLIELSDVLDCTPGDLFEKIFTHGVD